MNAPISRNLIEPKLISNLFFVDSIEEFEKLELQPNETKGAFDNFKPCIYTRSRDRFGVYGRVMIYFYEDFATKVEGITQEEFIRKCREVELNNHKTELAIKFFLENMTNEDVLDWACKNGLNYTKDSLRVAKSRIRAKLSNVLAFLKYAKKNVTK